MTLERLKILLLEDNLTAAHWVQDLSWKVDVEQFELTQVTSKDAAIAYLENKQSNMMSVCFISC